MPNWLSRHRWKLAHAIRISAASIAAYAATNLLGQGQGLWAVVTAIVVTQGSIGGSLKVALEQFIGSLFGGIYATAVALILSPNDPVSSGVALTIALAPLSILAAFVAGFRIAPITGAIVLLGAAGPDVWPLSFAASRILEVSIGCGIALCVSVYVVPVSASRSAIETAKQIVDLMAKQLRALRAKDAKSKGELGSLSGTIRGRLIQLQSSVEEAAREKRAWITDAPDEMRMLRTLGRLRGDIDLLRRAVGHSYSKALPEQIVEALFRATTSGAAALENIGRTLVGEPATEAAYPFAEAVQAFRRALDEIGHASLTRSHSTATLSHLFGSEFVFGQLQRDLHDMLDLSKRSTQRAARPS